ncbi:SRPBCC family protein [Lentibacillus sp. L22]|uniref:SRPBCC family protein n=1 Tax=Lentibacillus TaxID=175304 RepID=UPI0022B0B6D4|nr:SRPBCC family protein [Lentibacillus daqui]
MIAKLDREKGVLTATYQRLLQHDPEEVWAYLTENNKLQQWFPELEIQTLQNGGEILFNLGDGSYEHMQITEAVTNRIFAFEWDKNAVRFELLVQASGSTLVFKEYLHEVTTHTPKDLAGWHVCLDVIEALLDGQSIEDRTAVWQAYYPKYQQALLDAQADL